MASFVQLRPVTLIYQTSLEQFWLDLVLRNPLDAEVNLSNLTIAVKCKGVDESSSARTYVDVELIDDIVLGYRETRTVRWFCFPRLFLFFDLYSADPYICQTSASRIS